MFVCVSTVTTLMKLTLYGTFQSEGNWLATPFLCVCGGVFAPRAGSVSGRNGRSGRGRTEEVSLWFLGVSGSRLSAVSL